MVISMYLSGLTLVVICVRLPGIHMHGVVSWTDFQNTTNMMTSYYLNNCYRYPTCTTSITWTLDTIQSSFRKCCIPCRCYKECILGDFCCSDAYAIDNYDGNSTNIKDVISEMYDVLREEILFNRYSVFLNETEGFSLEENDDLFGIFRRSRCQQVTLFSNTFEHLYVGARYLVNECPVTYRNDSDANVRCIGAVNDIGMADMTPETSVITSISYKNKYCRQCNEPASSSIPWEMRLYCRKDDLIQLPSFSSMYDLIEFDERNINCTILFQPSENLRSMTFSPFCLNVHVSSCNVSGKWETYDAGIELACETIFGPIVSSIKGYANGNVVFKNSACFLCNSNDEDTLYQFPCRGRGLNYATDSPFAVYASININHGSDSPFHGFPKSQHTDEVHACDVGTFYDMSQGSCRKSNCPKDHRERANACVPIFEFLNGISIGVKFKIKFESSFFMAFLSNMETILMDTVIGHFTANGMALCKFSQWRKLKDSSQKEVDFFVFHAKIIGSEESTYSSIWSSMEMLFKERSPLGEFRDMNNNPVDYKITFADEIIYDKKESYDTGSLEEQLLQQSSARSTIDKDNCPVTITISHSSFCERVLLKSGEYEVQNDRLVLKESAYSIPKGKFDLDGNIAHICIDEFKKGLQTRSKNTISVNAGISLGEYLSGNASIGLTSILGIILASFVIISFFLLVFFYRKRFFLRLRQ